MPRLKVGLTFIVISICSLSFVGILLTTILSTKVPTHSLSSDSLAGKPMSTFLFDYNKTEHVVLDCITGDVIGVRPSDVATVDLRELRSSKHYNLDQHRKAMFTEILHKKELNKNSKVDFSASGKPHCTVYFLSGTGPISLLSLLLFLFLLGRQSSKKPKVRFVFPNRRGLKFGWIVLQVNMHRLSGVGFSV